MPVPAFADPNVAAVFESYPKTSRARLLRLRRLIFSVAKQTPGVGAIHEALRWGEPSYLTLESGSGSMVRLGIPKDDPSKLALYFHCQSGLVDTFRDLYGNTLTFGGKRSILLGPGDDLDAEALHHCVSLALTHHQRKRPAKARTG